MAKALKIIGVTLSLSWIMFIALALFVRSLGIIFEDWFNTYAVIIAISSGIVVLIGLITGTIALSSLTSKGKGLW